MQPLGVQRENHGSRPLGSHVHASDCGSLTEIVIDHNSAVQPLQLLPILAQCNTNQRWLMWLSPHQRVNKRWLEKVGLQQTPVIHIDLCEDNQYALSAKILEAGNSHMIIEWQGALSESQREAIRQHAIDSGSQVILLRTEA